MHPSLTCIAHRPWPMPPGQWTWRQSWCDLLFAHWPVAASALRALVPPALTIQEFDGTSWVGLVPFRMSGVMRRGLPDLPGVSAFAELNVRLYVEHEGKPGVWFLSLDADNALAVWAARRFFHLPYYNARIELTEAGGAIRYTATRRGGGPRLEARYRPTSAVYESRPGTLEHWLTERYCLYAETPDGAIVRNDVHHRPWPLQHAEAEIAHQSYLASHGLGVEGPPTVLHFAQRIDVVVWNGVQVVTAGPRS